MIKLNIYMHQLVTNMFLFLLGWLL